MLRRVLNIISIFGEEEVVRAVLLTLCAGCGGLLVLDQLIIYNHVLKGLSFMPHKEHQR